MSRVERTAGGGGVALDVLMVDHDDSFLWNIVQDLGERVGASPRVVSHHADLSEALVGPVDLLVLGPGPGHPERKEDAGIAPKLLRRYAGECPIFGVCLGLQLVLTTFGGAIRPAREVVHGKSLDVLHGGDRLFDGLESPTPMMRYHSWVADADRIPTELEVTATSSDGEVMGLRHRGLPIEAVQFHPESVGSPGGTRVLDNVVRWARDWKSRRIQGESEQGERVSGERMP